MSALERIVAVAHQWKGLTFSLPAPARHHDVIHAMAGANIPHEARAPDAQGFLTSRGRWVSREEAAAIAEIAQQPLRPIELRGSVADKTYPLRRLYSEDLW